MDTALGPLVAEVAARARRRGPLGYDEVLELALYDPDHGFYATGGGAGRQGDFLTSPEVGPLFGAVVARALDSWWRDLDGPEPFTVVEAGAGRGSLARAVLGAAPACRTALRYVAVERSAALRAQHPAEVDSAAELPSRPVTGIVLANELLDNLPFRLLELGAEGWQEVRVDEHLTEVLTPDRSGAGERFAPDAPVGSRIPVQPGAAGCLADALRLVARGRVVLVDYADSTASMARRPWTDWVRTYRGHGRGSHPLADLGRQDVTCEVAVDQLVAVRPPTADRSQAEFLKAHGIDELAAAARLAWQERAHVGDLQALVARSRVAEAAALTDQSGLGAFRVLEWAQGT
ncbi:MAG: SAM-dependent methyltransferase [Actinomycetota bacterium]|nr:SAM-dependent methyltransferase [Actinomycetota bacterium]